MPAIAHQNKILGNTSGGGSTILVTTSESTLYGQTVTLSDGTTTLTGTFSNAGECEFTGVMMVGTLTATSGTASTSINVPYFGVYSIILSLFSATITATFPSGATCTCVGNGETYTASTSPHTFTVHGAATYRVTATIDGQSKYDDVVISTDGQTASITIEYGTINVTYDNAFRGTSITCVQGGTTITKTAPSGANTMTFYPPTTGNWVISGTVSGTSYSKTANVTSLSTSVSVSLETVPNGKTVLPTDDIETWLACAQISDVSYTTLAEVLDDPETYERLLADSNACDYLARCTDWVGMGAGLVPVMTSDTMPSGTASASVESGSTTPAYYAFSGGGNTWALYKQSSVGAWVRYDFATGTTHKVSVAIITGGANQSFGTDPVKFKIQASNDGTTWDDISGEVSWYLTESGTTKKIPLDVNDTAYNKFRVYFTTNMGSDGSHFFGLSSVQFYANPEGITDSADAMMRLGKYDYACYVLRDDNTWNTAINNSAYASYIPASPTGQTNIIVTAHGGDTVYYMENGSPVTLTTADSDTGIGTVDWSDLPKGAITLYSSTAKNPSDLTADYSKTVYVTEYTTQIYLMPDNALYWWGYEGADFEVCSTANGWSNYPAGTPTFNTDNVLQTGSSVAGTNLPSSYSIEMIIKSAESYYEVFGVDVKNYNSVTTIAVGTTVSTPTKFEYTSLSYKYVTIGTAGSSRSVALSALWYE